MIDLICPVCGITFQKPPSYIKNVKIKTCSLKCMGIWNSKNRHGRLSSGWKDGRSQTEYICEYCNKEFIAGECEDRKYCSPECGHKDRLGKPGLKSGERLNLICEWCSNEFERLKCNIRSDYKHNFCSNDCQYAWMSENTRGENNWRWISDRTKVKNGRLDILRTSTDMKDWKLNVYNRDDFTCQLCDSTESGTFNCHHIKKLSKYPELAYDISNGITLCVDCHKIVTWNEKEYENLFDSIVNGFEC